MKMDVRLKHPFTAIVAGPTGCGKSTFVKRLIDHKEEMIVPVPECIVWHYGEYQHMYSQCGSGIEFKEGLPHMDTFDGEKPVMLVIDDLMSETDDSVTQLFTKGSHHRNISVLYLVQNVFDKNKHSRTISLNAHYVVFFKNPRDASQILHLAKQMYPGHVKYMQEAYKDATSQPFGYLFVDLKQDTDEDYRLRTNIIPNGERQYVYIKK